MAAGAAVEHSVADQILLPEEVTDGVLKNGKTKMYLLLYIIF